MTMHTPVQCALGVATLAIAPGTGGRWAALPGGEVRQIIRLFDDVVREVTVDVSKGLLYKARQQQRTLQQRLLRKRLQPLLQGAIKAFRPGYESANNA